VKIDGEDLAVILLASLPKSYDDLMTALLVGKETTNVEDITAMLLNSKIFKKLSSGNKGRACVMNFDHGDENTLRRTNCDRIKSRSRSKPRVDYSNKEYYYYHRKGHIQFYCRRLKSDLKEFKEKKKKSCEEHVDVASTAVGEVHDDDLLKVRIR